MKQRGADLLVRGLKAAGVTRIFSLSGNHIMEIYDALVGAGIELVHTRHEAAAVHMADAYARLTGQVGVAMVTGGQGHANAVAALPTALAGEVPVLLLSGHAPLGELGNGAFQELPQAAMAAPVCKAAWTAGERGRPRRRHRPRRLPRALRPPRPGASQPAHRPARGRAVRNRGARRGRLRAHRHAARRHDGADRGGAGGRRRSAAAAGPARPLHPRRHRRARCAGGRERPAGRADELAARASPTPRSAPSPSCCRRPT
jgi:hypothetical protein